MALTKVRGLGLGTLDDNITFSTAGKGVHLGVTSATASNLLDDYEEGTFTPTVTEASTDLPSISYTQQTGEYTRIGRSIHVEITITFTASANYNIRRLRGLPFTVSSGGAPSSGIGMLNINYDTGDVPIAQASNTTTYLNCATIGSNIINDYPRTRSGTMYIRVSYTYKTS